MYGSPPLLFGCFPQMAAVSGFRIRSLVHCFQKPILLHQLLPAETVHPMGIFAELFLVFQEICEFIWKNIAPAAMGGDGISFLCVSQQMITTHNFPYNSLHSAYFSYVS